MFEINYLYLWPLNLLSSLIKNLKFKINNYARFPWFYPVVVFLAAFLVRLLYLWFIKDDPLVTMPILDGQVYSDWGREIARGAWWARTPYWTEPGYAYFLAICIKLGLPNWGIILCQFVLGSLSAVFLYLAAQKLWGKEAGLLAGLGQAFLVPAIFNEGVLLKTSWEIFLICLVLLLIIQWWGSSKWWQMLSMGLVLGLSAIFKANNLVIPLVLALSILRNLSSFRKAAWLLLGVALIITPIVWLNYYTGKDIVLISYSAGPNFYIGNFSGSDGSFKVPEFVSLDAETEAISWTRMGEAYTGYPLKPSQVSAFWLGETFKEIVRNPSFFFANSFKKAALIFNPLEIGDNYDLGYGQKLFWPLYLMLPFWLIALMGVAGIVLSGKKRQPAYLTLYIILITYFLSLVFTHIAGRYRLALAPVLILFSSYLVIWVKQKLLIGEWGKITGLVVGMIIASPLFLLQFKDVSTTTIADMYNNMASQLDNQDYPELAEKYYQESINNNKYFPSPKANLAKLYLTQRKVDEAVKLYQQTIALQPDYSSKGLKLALTTKQKNLSRGDITREFRLMKDEAKDRAFLYDLDYVQGLKLLREKKYPEAVPYLEKALENDLGAWDVMSNLGVAYRSSNKLDEAMNLYLKAVFIDEYNLPARYNLANLYASQKKFKDASYHYQQILEWVPDYALARFYLGDVSFKMGNEGEALIQFKTFLEESQESIGKGEQRKKAEQAVRFLIDKIGKNQPSQPQASGSADEQDVSVGQE